MNPIGAFLLENCFWEFLDIALPGEETPLLTGIFEGHPLAEILCQRFGISLEEAEFEIEAARREVEL